MTGRANIPCVQVVVDGVDITPLLDGKVARSQRRRLVSLGLTEKRGGEADQLDLVIDDTDGKMEIPRAGAKIRVSIGWQQGGDVRPGLVDKGLFTVDEVEHGGPPDLITIRARAADFTSEIRTRRQHSWHDATLGAIVTDLAGRNQLEARCAPALASIPVKAIAQSRESDVAFLRRLGRAHDAVATVKDGKLVFAPVGAGVTTTGKPLPARTIRRRDGDTHSYKVKQAEEAGAVEADWHDRKAAARKTEKVGTGRGKTRRLSRTYPSKEAASTAARAEHTRAGRQPVTLDLTLALGDPALAPEQRVTATGYKAAIDATSWLVSEVAHAINDRGFATKLKLEAG
ncbi:contractile injection system protein, VgrG/Pvc8 family [Sphingomonas oligophenolica]|uniref:Phage late control D family protein n=1 Tax=Sphingomonas oligophenolica TaxID=301154 RepID=A0A502CQI0_9SPHN|nr:contractile injection system protein, VgrG/Pvc8 family [Sphingomonas oligophenolica]TPG14379.1 phage late control D family protein [Sphingomonas oligophenolica]